MRAKIVIIETTSGNRYVLVYDGRPRHEFTSVTAAQLFCLENNIPFEPWE
jgi:hypothetical protein